jgi:hypothetical protein
LNFRNIKNIDFYIYFFPRISKKYKNINYLIIFDYYEIEKKNHKYNSNYKKNNYKYNNNEISINKLK